MVSTYREIDMSWGIWKYLAATTKAISPNGSLWPAETETIDAEDFVNIGGNICAI